MGGLNPPTPLPLRTPLQDKPQGKSCLYTANVTTGLMKKLIFIGLFAFLYLYIFLYSFLYSLILIFAFSSVLTFYAKSNYFSETVLQHLLSVYCKPYLLHGADVINLTASELSNLRCTLNSAMCKIYKVKFQLLDGTDKYTNQIDIADVIKHMQKIFHVEIAAL